MPASARTDAAAEGRLPSDNDFGAVAQRLRDLAGIALGHDKSELIASRLRRRMRDLGLDSVRAYLRRVDESEAEREIFVNSLTTNESRFFRTARVWTYLESEFLRRWRDGDGKGLLRIWSAAASKGQEAYSLAMLCLEKGVPDFRVFASDLDTAALDAARLGHYEGRVWMDLREKRPQWPERYGETRNDCFRVGAALKTKVEFRRHNLLEEWRGAGLMHLVMLRNVLIYFEAAEQERVLGNVWDATAEGGVLILGESESLSQVEERLAARGQVWQYVAPQIYRRLRAGD